MSATTQPLTVDRKEPLDALFIPFYSNIDRWHNDGVDDTPVPNLARARAMMAALWSDDWMKDEIDLVIGGKLFDFSRFLSWVRSGTTKESDRYDPFNMTLLAGTYYLDLLHRHGYSVRVANVTDRHKLIQLGQKYEPRYVMLSTTLLFDGAEQDLVALAVRELRRNWPNAVIIVGGLMLVSYQKNLPKPVFHDLLLYYGADVYVVTPQGENSALEILASGSLEALLKTGIPPLTYVVHSGVVHEPPTTPEVGLKMEDSWIRWSQLPQTDHLYHTVHVRTARSCAFKCAFCEYPVNQGPLTLTPVEVVDQELSEIQSLGTIRSLIFTDDTFNVPLPRFKQLLHVLAKYDFEWYSFFRPQYANEETARLMKESGCKAVFAGLESVDDQVLKNMAKYAKGDDYRRGIEQLKKQDIGIHANFIVGFPGETELSARKIAPFINEMGIEFCTVTIWAYISSTPIAARAQEFGIRGEWLDWQHNTMTSKEAQKLARAVVSECSAVHNAVRGEAWTEFLLYANGFRVDEAKMAVSTYNRFLGRDVSAAEIQATVEFQGLKTLLEAHPLPKPQG